MKLRRVELPSKHECFDWDFASNMRAERSEDLIIYRQNVGETLVFDRQICGARTFMRLNFNFLKYELGAAQQAQPIYWRAILRSNIRRRRGTSRAVAKQPGACRPWRHI